MRPATSHDRATIEDLVQARTRWLHGRGHDPALLDPTLAKELAGQHEQGRPLSWVACEDDRVLGTTCLLTIMPEDTWTQEELRQPAVLMAGTWTHPGQRSDKLGQLIAWWVLDYASGLNVQQVRRITYSDQLMTRYRDRHGWNLLRSVPRLGRRMHLLQRPPRADTRAGGPDHRPGFTAARALGAHHREGEAQWITSPICRPHRTKTL